MRDNPVLLGVEEHLYIMNVDVSNKTLERCHMFNQLAVLLTPRYSLIALRFPLSLVLMAALTCFAVLLCLLSRELS